MKIAYLGNYTQKHCTEVHLAITLEDLGHEVVRIQELNINVKADNYFNQIKDCDLFLWTRTWQANDTMHKVLEMCRQAGITSVSYHLDLYVGLQRQNGLDNDPFWRTDYVFTPDGAESSAEVFKKKGINHFYMKPAVFKGECYISPIGAATFRPDVIFVGGGTPTGEGEQYGHKEWPYRGQLLKFLKDTYGNRYKKFGHPMKTVRNEELNELYAATKVVVGDSLCLNFNHPYYWSDRVYETLGRGGFIIHPYIQGMEEEFTNGETIVFYEYNNWDQLKELIDKYLVDDEAREKIRRAGHEYVKNNATYNNRLTQMLETVMPKKVNEIPQAEGAKKKINFGAGEDQFEGYVNVDMLDLPGIDVVHNLMEFPYPFDDNSASNIKAMDVIEHLANYTPDNRPSVIAFIDECHRILEPGGELYIQTPGHNAEFLWIDPTHVRGFHRESMDFFDPDKPFGQTTGFYSKSKFKVSVEELENHNLRFTMIKR